MDNKYNVLEVTLTKNDVVLYENLLTKVQFNKLLRYVKELIK